MSDTTDNGDCGHSELEHKAFDRGVRDGETGILVECCPYKRESLIDAWENGHSVGEINRGAEVKS